MSNRDKIRRLALHAGFKLKQQLRKNPWTSVEDDLPRSNNGEWSKPVIALGDNGDVFKLSHNGEDWQRDAQFTNSNATRIEYWQPINDPEEPWNHE